jgi:hypothetical protein
VLKPEEQRYRIAERLRRLNELGFDVDEVELIETPEGNRLRLKTGSPSRGITGGCSTCAPVWTSRRTRPAVCSTTSRASVATWRAKERRALPDALVANRWLAEVFDPILAAIPEHLRDRLQPAEVFHEILEHRWYLSEAAQVDVGTTAAAKSYFGTVLPAVPEDLTSGSGGG